MNPDRGGAEKITRAPLRIAQLLPIPTNKEYIRKFIGGIIISDNCGRNERALGTVEGRNLFKVGEGGRGRRKKPGGEGEPGEKN
ncbi:hypothetical protein GWI33_017657 [Rhynchophorus ferrugineus]|uniref:Uncharacterized protein n=1 Tax=Rhynchophorus ferrugineus TaxID=354439 RepID=A0A834HYV0_RHYFE|nr:hypothetical protein GWI33_017657 [Rhynchophorus ferrugineus]